MERQVPPRFEFRYTPGDIVVGAGCVETIGETLAALGSERALVVCGHNVGSNPAVMDPIRASLDDRLVGVYDETTPAKTGDEVLGGVGELAETGADSVIAVGGGSTMDVARVMVAMAAEGGPIESLHSTLDPQGHWSIPDLAEPKLPIIAVPTTLSGAELGSATGANFSEAFQDLDPDLRVGPIYDDKLVPHALYYDPDLVASTPSTVLAASAMNGLDHGIEMLYSRHANPITDAVAVHGLHLLDSALPTVIPDRDDTDAMVTALSGLVLASYGLIDPFGDGDKFNLIHAFGHAIAIRGVQQGAAHGVIAPSALRYVFETVDGNRTRLASAFGVDTSLDEDAIAVAVVDAVASLRDTLGLPGALRDVPEISRADLPDIAAAVNVDIGLENAPAGLDPSTADLLDILEDAW